MYKNNPWCCSTQRTIYLPASQRQSRISHPMAHRQISIATDYCEYSISQEIHRISVPLEAVTVRMLIRSTRPLANQTISQRLALNQAMQLQSTLVISNSKGLSEILRDIRTSTYQICRIGEKTNSINHI